MALNTIYQDLGLDITDTTSPEDATEAVRQRVQGIIDLAREVEHGPDALIQALGAAGFAKLVVDLRAAQNVISMIPEGPSIEGIQMSFDINGDTPLSIADHERSGTTNPFRKLAHRLPNFPKRDTDQSDGPLNPSIVINGMEFFAADKRSIARTPGAIAQGRKKHSGRGESATFPEDQCVSTIEELRAATTSTDGRFDGKALLRFKNVGDAGIEILRKSLRAMGLLDKDNKWIDEA
jgi:hypothetical protein